MTEVVSPTKAEHVSFSQMLLAAQCGEAYRRKYIAADPADRVNLPAVVGGAVHSAVEEFELAHWNNQKLVAMYDGGWQAMAEQLELVTKRHLNDELERLPMEPEEIPHFGKQDLEWWRREKIRKLIDTYLERRRAELVGGWQWFGQQASDSVEVEVRAEVGGHEFLAIIDQLVIDSRDRLVIRDLKTGETKGFHAAQLEFYRVLLKRGLGLFAHYGLLTYIKRKTPYLQTVKWSLSDDEVDEMVHRLLNNVETGSLMVAGPFTGHCTVCDFRRDCPWGNITPHGSS